MLGAGLSAASLLLAWSLARQITRPIDQLRQSFADFSVVPGKPIVVGPSEIMELQDTLYYAAVERQNRAWPSWGPFPSSSTRWPCVRRRRLLSPQSQRMEALGQLAGGMAHDSNNVLAAISANLDAVTLRSSDEKTGEAIEAAMDAIQMGASLNRRLLFLSRPQGVGLERLDLNDRVTGTLELLKRTLWRAGDRLLRLSPDPCQTSANPGDVDNAILNLAINARDGHAQRRQAHDRDPPRND